MTLLESLITSMFDVITIGGELYTTSTCTLDGDGNLTPEGVTTLTCMTSTVLNNIEVSNHIVRVQDTIAYVESMSEEELEKFDELLAAKNLDIEKLGESVDQQQETPKVYKK